MAVGQVQPRRAWRYPSSRCLTR